MSTARIGIDYLSCAELTPIERAHVAADLGCGHFGLSAEPAGHLTERLLQQDLWAVMASRGVSISMVEGFAISPEQNIADRISEFDALSDLGVAAVNIYSFDDDRSRTIDQLSIFAEMASARDIQPLFEFVPCLPIRNLPQALRTLTEVENPELKLVIDFMHVLRSGCTTAELTAVDPSLIGYIQVCDVPLMAQVPDYGEEACHFRLPLGDGDVQLASLLAALPRNLPFGLEIPMTPKAEAGVPAAERLASSVARLRDLLANIDKS